MTATAPLADAAVPNGCTCSKLRRLTRRVTAVYDRELAASGLRVTQYALLSALQREAGGLATSPPGRPRGESRRAQPEGTPMNLLAERMDMDRTTLTRNLKPLVDQGWAELVPAPHDARVRLARITPAGTAAWAAARPHWKRAQLEINRTLGDTTVAGLHQWIDAVIPALRPSTDSHPEESTA